MTTFNQSAFLFSIVELCVCKVKIDTDLRLKLQDNAQAGKKGKGRLIKHVQFSETVCHGKRHDLTIAMVFAYFLRVVVLCGFLLSGSNKAFLGLM